MPCPRTQQANLPACSPQPPLNAERQAGKLRMPFFKVFWYDSTRGMNSRSTDCEADALTTTPSRRFGPHMTQQCHSLFAYCTIYGPTTTWVNVVQYPIRKCIIFTVAYCTTCVPSFLLSKLNEHRQMIALTSSHGDDLSQTGSKNAVSVSQYSNTAHIAIHGERVK